MLARLFGLVAVVCASGCVKQYDVVMAPEQARADDYVVVQYTRAGGIKLWDCRSEPDRQSWDPTCVRVRMQNSAREQAQ